jgi:hypothetical protein
MTDLGQGVAVPGSMGAGFSQIALKLIPRL